MWVYHPPAVVAHIIVNQNSVGYVAQLPWFFKLIQRKFNGSVFHLNVLIFVGIGI